MNNLFGKVNRSVAGPPEVELFHHAEDRGIILRQPMNNPNKKPDVIHMTVEQAEEMIALLKGFVAIYKR